jgi:hypothetical protein
MKDTRQAKNGRGTRRSAAAEKFSRDVRALSDKSVASVKKRLTLDEINKLLAERRGGASK